MILSDFLDKLEGVKKQSGGYIARCPSHDDKNASLSVSEGDDGRILIKCHAGCSPDAITGEFGLALRDLFAQPPTKTKREIDQVYDYRDESGKLLFQSVRFTPKGFSQRKPDGSGGWKWELNGTRRVPYHLPELLAADPSATVFILEGEKDVDRLRAAGLTATTNPQGAGKWRDDYSQFLKDREVVIVPDNDEPGRKHAAAVALSLRRVAASVKVLALPGLPEKGDVSDWLDAGGQLETLCAMVDDLAEWTPTTIQENTKATPPLLSVVRMSDVQAKKVSYVWPQRIALRALTIVEGIEGEGKSTLLVAITAAISRGKGLPETDSCEPANVVWLSAEDDLETVLKPRLEAVGADCERVFAVGEPFTLDERGLWGLRQAIATYQPKLVIIDPIFAYTRGDANKGNDARSLTGELKKIADQFDCAICIVRHVGKSKGQGDPRAAGLYSIEWRAAARSVLLAGADPDDPNKRALAQTKNNLGTKAASIGYLIESDSESPSGARFFWTGQSDLTAERILEAAGRRGETTPETNGRSDAEDFLRSLLGDGPMLATDVDKEAKEAKISFSTLRRAKDAIGVRSQQRGFGKSKKWYWVLPLEFNMPSDAQSDAQMLRDSEGEHLRANDTNKSNYANGFASDAHLETNEHLSGPDERLFELLYPIQAGLAESLNAEREVIEI